MQKKILEGTVKRHPDGFGFLIPNDREHPDVYIPKHSMNGIMSNDRVQVEVSPAREAKNRYFGEIVKFIDRQTKSVYGQFYKMSNQYGIITDHEGSWGSDIYIPLAESKNAQDGQIVAVQLSKETTQSGHIMGKVSEVLGNLQDPMNDLKRVLINNQLPQEFSKPAQKEADQYPTEVLPEEFEGRKDLTKMGFITIDGVTAKDFDDAIYVEVSNSGFHLWVAIADVSHYVKPGMAINEDAYKRGTSTYFPKFVVPMLPEALSNELCSLKPNVNRLSLVCEVNFDFTGETLNYQVYEAVIKSQARVTYGLAQEVVDGNTPPELKHVEQNILRAKDLAKLLMAKRFREGSLDLELPETQIILDDLGNPIDIIRAERIFSHRLIEELMLIANVCVARYLNDRNAECLYRIHEAPLEDNIKMLERFLFNFGGPYKVTGGKLQKKLSAVLEEFSGKAEGEALGMLILRSMMQAKYSANNVGHFGLAFSHYAHFTSPIRRYPDLMVHRQLKHFCVDKKRYPLRNFEELETAGVWLSACEQKSVKAERQLRAIKCARFMQKFIGETFDGVISSVNKMGIFVVLRQYDVSGLVKMDAIGIGQMEYDEENLMLISPKTGIYFKVGDTLRVTVSMANIEEGKVDFVIDGELKPNATPPPVRSKSKDKKFKKQSNKHERNSSSKGRPGKIELKSSHRGGKSQFSKFRRNKKKRK